MVALLLIASAAAAAAAAAATAVVTLQQLTDFDRKPFEKEQVALRRGEWRLLGEKQKSLRWPFFFWRWSYGSNF